MGQSTSGAGDAPVMDNSREDKKTTRTNIWMAEHSFQGWTCSQCDWNYPLPTLLNDPAAKTAYDRLALAKFREHACENHAPRLGPGDGQSFTARIRRLAKEGFKPKDAVELLLQEVMLEYRNQPKILELARAEGEDFLRRVKEGLI